MIYHLKIKTQGNTDVVEIGSLVAEKVKESGIEEGLVSLWVVGSTAAITTLEYEPGLIADEKRFWEEIIPSSRDYAHNNRWGDDNGFSHLRASLLGPSLTIPLEKGRLVLGQWQQIVLIDFDNRPREREVVVKILSSDSSLGKNIVK